MLCHLCKGTGFLICFPGGKPEWWDCPSCGTSGVLVQFAKPEIKIHVMKKKKTKQMQRKE